ncbi:MAG: Ig-like domain-containing protein [Alphaproteobacteria bacterium]|nr:Ig-like domain-containing protein [Alphaproteobacteria bacterium]
MDAQYSAWLTLGEAERALGATQLSDYGTLTATVPEGLTPGLYHLRVQAPWGASSELRNAFTVTDTRADHLQIELDTRVAEVDEDVQVGLRVLDPDGQVVPVDLPLLFSVSSEEGASGVHFSDVQGLGDWSELPRGHGLRGTINDGIGWVTLSSLTPDDLQLDVVVDDADSTIDPDSELLLFVPGALDRVEIELESDDFEATAGEDFRAVLTLRDDVGNVLTDRDATVYLREACGGLATDDGVVEIRNGYGVVQARVTTATSASGDCPINGLEAYGEASGSSQGFDVAPAPLDGLDVLLSSGQGFSVTAGEPELTVIVKAADAYGNLHRDYNATLAFADDVGGLDTDDSPPVGAAECLGWVDGQLPCTLTLTRAAESVFIIAESLNDGLNGSGGPVTVVAGSAVGLQASAQQSTVAAGDLLDFQVRLTDAWGNSATANDLDFFVLDGSERLSCLAPSLQQSGAYRLSCTPTRADAAVEFEVSIPALGLSDLAGPVLVENGALGSVQMSAPASVVAGEAFTLSAQGYDVYGNPYLLGDPTVDLVDGPGTIDTPSFDLDSAGAWSGEVTLTGAGEAIRLTASQGGVDLGAVSLEVLAASLDHYAVTTQRPWIWVGEDVALTLTAEDIYDNAVAAHAEPVTLSSDQGLFVSQQVSDFEGGVASVTLRFDDVGLGDRVRAEDADGVLGSSTQLDVLDADCAEPPSAELLLNGAEEASACLTLGSGSVAVDMSGSVAGAAAITRYHLADGEGDFSRTTSGSTTLSYTQAGLYTPTLVVVDADACGAVAEGVLWMNDKGEPAGEVSVSLAHSSRTAGGAAADADTTVDVIAVDCAGDPASGVQLFARTNLGELSAGVVSGSEGLYLTLDSAGEGSFTWSAQSEDHDGEATISVGVLSGAAYGGASLDVEGDSHRPTIAQMDPSGASEELLSEIVIWFTEPMASGDYDSKVSLSGPSGVVSIETALSSDGLSLSVVPATTLDASSGSWQLTLAQSARDDSGNRLSGNWSGSASDFTGQFGDVLDEGISVSRCSADLTRITPDGVHGFGDEADAVTLSVAADAAPTWWLMEVYDADGERILTERSAGGSASTQLSWSAQGDDGIVVPAGIWRVDLSTADGQGNLSAPCSLDVQVVERYSAP